MPFLRYALPLTLALLASTSSFAASFKDWEVGCDNTRACKAVGMSSSDGGSSGYLTLTRGGRPDDKPQASFWFNANYADSSVKDKDFRLTVDDKPVSGIDHEIRFAGGGSDDLFEVKLSPEEIAALIQAFRNGTELKLTAADGTVGADVSLNGSMASLLYMDDKQHRIGTVTALARPGSQPADAVPVPPAAPEVTVATAGENAKANEAFLQAIWRKLKKDKDDSCVNADPDDSQSKAADGEVDALDANHTLVTINCSGGGAYNMDSEFFVVAGADVARARLVSFPTLAEEGSKKPPEPATSLVNAGYDAKEGTIGYFAKGRGIGDCGDSGTYAWNGKAFVLVGTSSMGQCKGVGSDDWPVYWRARIVPAQ